jgi:hypothetical protein
MLTKAKLAQLGTSVESMQERTKLLDEIIEA